MSAGRAFSRLLVITVAAATCTFATAQTIDPIQNPSASAPPQNTTTTSAPACEPGPVAETLIPGADPPALSLAISAVAFECATHAVVASGDPGTLMVGAQLAAAAGGPLLVVGDDPALLAAELQRLSPALVYSVGDRLPALPSGTESQALSLPQATAETASLLGGAPVLQGTGSAVLGRTIIAATTGTAVLSGPLAADLGLDSAWAARYAPATSTVWLADGTSPEMVAPALAAAGARGETLLLADPADLRRPPSTVEAHRRLRPGQTIVAGGFPAALVEWQLPALLTAPELPGGGLVFYPGRRLVALYGNPTTPALGVLGEQGPEAAVERVLEVAAGYDADGVPVLPGFEIIATVASASAGADNDYSEEMSLDTLRPWIEAAAARGVYVILDLQPGRTDFLTQATRYEEFLRLPHVGLALDPEWRLQPNQVHLRQIGSVDAAEINQVSAWLAGIVREENLPQKFFLLHQFRLDMITNRSQVATPAELAVVIQMDGQGPLSTKYDTWAALIAGTADAGFSWGWKNFYDEDTPQGGATAEQVLDLDPVPVYVSFQ